MGFELYSYGNTFSFVPINLLDCWPRDLKRFIGKELAAAIYVISLNVSTVSFSFLFLTISISAGRFTLYSSFRRLPGKIVYNRKQ